MNELNRDVLILNALLDLNREIVGIKLTENQEEYEEFEGKEIKNPITYCSAVKLATEGYSLKLPKEMCGCKGASRALGFEKAGESYYDGTDPCKLGLFDDKEIASRVSEETTFIKESKNGAVIKPLEKFEKKPDMVLIVTNTYNSMRIMQGYTCEFGLQNNMCISGNQAICVECTSNPYVRNNINISMMCAGTRFYSKWGKDEVGIGIPIDKFHRLVEGIRKTANSVENDTEKKRIIQKLNEIGESSEDLKMDYTYYLEIEREKRRERENAKKTKTNWKN